ncbi:MAG: hypothetical protein P1R58_02880 [bacterium]|nr:hypothetical protein [bacterium]
MMTNIKLSKRLKQKSGFTILEVLISALMVGIITTAAFQFYVSIHTQSEKQYEQSEVQAVCRASIFDIKKTLRMAGFRVGGHAPYEISNDTLSIYMNTTGTMDTIRYYLEEFTDWEYGQLPGFPSGKQLFRLMKQTNSDPPAIFSEYISSMTYTVVDASNITISVTAYVTKVDETYSPDGGYRSFSIGDRINLRNVG